MITLIENDISLEEYLTLREKVGWKKLTDKQAAHALANCLYKVKAVDADGQVVGMGRVVGDVSSEASRCMASSRQATRTRARLPQAGLEPASSSS